MTKVAVDAEDLGTLLLATAAIKGIESALKVCADDPATMDASSRMTECHDRVANAWRDAMRREQYPERYAEPAVAEVTQLQQMWPHLGNDEDLRFLPIKLETPVAAIYATGATTAESFHAAATRNRRGIRLLMTNGLIELGVRRDTMIWGSSGQITQKDTPEQWARITERGIDAVLKAENALRGLPPPSRD